MGRIIAYVESNGLERIAGLVDVRDEEATDGIVRPRSTARALTGAAVAVAREVDAKYLIAFTSTGAAARLIARWRPQTPLLAFTPNPRVRSQLALTWGVETFLVPDVSHTDDMVRQVDRALLDIGRATHGERVVIVAGVPPGIPGTTNGMRVHRIGSGIPGSGV
jgi:pyruvate kinase